MSQAGSIRRVVVVGAGLAGLSAAVRLAQRGMKVTLIEAAMQAGGRCRAYHDPVLDMTIDNGNHFVVSGNKAVNGYLELLGASAGLRGLGDRGPAFHDLADGSTWTLWPNDSPAPLVDICPKPPRPGHEARGLSDAGAAAVSAMRASESTKSSVAAARYGTGSSAHSCWARSIPSRNPLPPTSPAR